MKTITLVALLCLATQAQGTPIIFTFAGTGTGVFGASPFSNAQFTITATADTLDASSVDPFVRQILVGAATVHVNGFETGQFGIALRLFHSPYVSLPPGSVGDETVGLSLASGFDLLNLFNPAFVGYDLVTDLGPVFVAAPDFQSRLSFNSVPTSTGAMTLTSSRNVTFTASVVPEPSQIALFGAGVAVFGFVARKRKSNQAVRRTGAETKVGASWRSA